jgi:hypothetical protein
LIEEYEPLLLATPDLLQAYWPHVAPLLEKCVRRAAHGEYTAEDIQRLAFAGRVFVFALVNDKYDPTVTRDVKLVLVLETVNYPRLPALNILAVGGSGLKMAYQKYWKMLCGWAYMSGVRAIEGWVSPSMKRTTEPMGFKPVYTHMRYDLEQSND